MNVFLILPLTVAVKLNYGTVFYSIFCCLTDSFVCNLMMQLCIGADSLKVIQHTWQLHGFSSMLTALCHVIVIIGFMSLPFLRYTT